MTAAVAVSWPQALAWRLRRHLLAPVGDGTVADVVRALGATAAWPDAVAELAVGARRRSHTPGDVARALAAGDVVKVFAFRGATHLVTPEEGGVYLALRASSRMWELPSWRSSYGLEPGDWPAFRADVRAALADGPLTTDELAAALPQPRLSAAVVDGSATLLKPLMWQGDMTFGPPRDGRTTFQRADANPRWGGIPDLDEAGRRAVVAYVRAYGPTTPAHLRYWYGEGLGAGRLLRSWTTALGDRLATVEVDGERCLLLAEDVDDLRATAPAEGTARLLPAYDQWVLGPGTKDAHVLPARFRPQVSRGAQVLVVDGVVRGTWTAADGDVRVEGDAVDRAALAAEVERLGAVVGRPLRLATARGDGGPATPAPA